MTSEIAWTDTNAHTEKLKPEWTSVCETLGVGTEAREQWWDGLVSHHGESARAYHTLAHLSELFDYLKEYRSKISDPTAVSLAIFFHDAIYKPRAGSPKNEMDSAVLFDTFAQEALPDGNPLGLAKGELIAKVRKWIAQTASHKVAKEDEMDCKLFMDFDMAVLGRPAEQYSMYSKQIYVEYGHVPRPFLCKARADFLQVTAAQESIYATDEFRAAFEAQARENMHAEAVLLAQEFACQNFIARLTAEVVLSHQMKKVKELVPKLTKPAAVAAVATSAYFAPQATGCLTLATAGIAALSGVRLLLGAKYVRYPYPEPTSQSGTVVLAGSYNPPHHGHLAMLKYLSKAHTNVKAIIGANPNKKYDVSPYQRQAILKAMLKDAGLTNVDVVVWGSIIFEYAHSVGASIMYRGIRTWKEDGRGEKSLEAQNLVYQPIKGYWPIPTAYLQGAPHLAHVSSTLLRNRLKENASIDDLVPANCAEAVRQAYAPTG